MGPGACQWAANEAPPWLGIAVYFQLTGTLPDPLLGPLFGPLFYHKVHFLMRGLNFNIVDPIYKFALNGNFSPKGQQDAMNERECCAPCTYKTYQKHILECSWTHFGSAGKIWFLVKCWRMGRSCTPKIKPHRASKLHSEISIPYQKNTKNLITKSIF